VRLTRILVATDFSPAGERAIRAAVTLARRENAALRVLHVAPPARWLTGLWGVGARSVEGVYTQADAALKRLVETADPARQVDISTGQVRGPAASRILTAVNDYRAGLLVVGARGENESAAQQPGLGGTAAKLLKRAQVPLLLVRRSPSAGPPTVLAAVDLSPVAPQVLDWARSCATGGNLQVLHAFDVPWTGRLEAYGLARGAVDAYAGFEHSRRAAALTALLQAPAGAESPAQLLEHGDPAALIVERARRIGASLVVVGKHDPRTRPGSARYGSVCQHVAWNAPADVLIVPAQ
jgi:nucleotide-binding universal stress UspA family protein